MEDLPQLQVYEVPHLICDVTDELIEFLLPTFKKGIIDHIHIVQRHHSVW